jgi:hypothetical protein
MTKTALLTVTAVACLTLSLASAARAETPHAGSNELHIEGNYLVPGLSVTGLSRISESNSGRSTTVTLMGVGFAYGRFLTDNLEIGSTINFLYTGASSQTSSSGTSQTGFGLSPFLRLFTMVHSRVGVYGGVTGGFQLMSPSIGNNATIWSVGGDAGAEFFIGDSWALRIGPSYRYMRENQDTGSGRSSTTTDHVIGANWALVGYF